MMKKTFILTTALLTTTLFACNNGGDASHSDSDTTAKDTMTMPEASTYSEEKNGLKVYEVADGTEYPDAKLELKTPLPGEILPADKYPFVFEVSNYELATPTADEADRHCAASAKGQHIHFIVDNGPYSAHYEPIVESKLEAGSHTVLAFLSRSYHESIKNGEAFVLRQINVGGAEQEVIKDLTQPMLFYSRPKGEYVGKDTKKILLDFYVVNTDLSANGYRVKATIDGNEFILPNWKPYMVEGLSMGEHTFRIVMLDAEGNEIEGSDSGDRIVTLKEAE